MSTDAVIPFSFEHLPVRGEIVQLETTWQRMQRDRDYGEPVREVLGHGAAASALIAQSLKFDGAITLQISGDGPLSMLVMQCTSDLELRGMASATTAADDVSYAEMVADARCAITVDAGAMERPYQGIVEVSGESLAESLRAYYVRSAQIPTHFKLVADRHCCGGILLQQMPGIVGFMPDDWYRLGMLAASLRTEDLAGGVGSELLARLFAEDDLRVFNPRAAVFRCRCSQARAEEVLRLLGEHETREACAEQGQVEVTCQYCGRKRAFDAVDISRLFATHPTQSSDAVH